MDKKLSFVPRRDTDGILSFSVIFEDFTAVCVKRTVVLFCDTMWTDRKLSFCSYNEYRCGGSSSFLVETELVPSSKSFVNLYRIHISKDENPDELMNCVTEVKQHVPCSF